MIYMFKKKLILEHESAIDLHFNLISPAKNHIPEWYKKIKKWKNDQVFQIGVGSNITVKSCMPFLDSLTTGYMIVLPHDLYILNNNGAPYIGWQDTSHPPQLRENLADPNLVPAGHYPVEYVWKFAVAINIPKNYSILFTHPLNRHDLPFTTLSGIVDSGLITSPTGSVPFYIKENFEGLIPQGTPIAQLIPIRQESWSLKIKNGLIEKSLKQKTLSNLVFSGWYKKNIWKRKNYE